MSRLILRNKKPYFSIGLDLNKRMRLAALTPPTSVFLRYLNFLVSGAERIQRSGVKAKRAPLGERKLFSDCVLGDSKRAALDLLVDANLQHLARYDDTLQLKRAVIEYVHTGGNLGIHTFFRVGVVLLAMLGVFESVA